MKWFFIFLVQVILLVTVGYLLTIYPGMITVNWIGYQAETSLLVFATIVLIISITFGLLIKILATLINAPFLLKSRYQKRSAEKGIHSVIEAMTAWSAQDSVQTVGKADEIRRFLHERDLANYLEAEAAFMKGDIQTAQRFYQDMLYAHGFQFLACQGMTRIYLKLHNDKQALEWAQKAKTAYSDSFWAHDIIVDLAIKTNNWELALTEINTLIKLNLGSQLDNKRKKASILTNLADHAKQQGDLKTALTYAEEAYELAQDKRDIVFLYVYLLRQLKGEKAAQSVVEQTWAISPDPRLAKLYLEITHPDSDQNKMKMIKRLASFAPHNPESFLATAHAAIDVKLWDEARELLSQLIADGYGTEEILKLSSRLENIAYS